MAIKSLPPSSADDLLAIAARHSCEHVLRAPRPLFATPGFHFTLDTTGRVGDRPIRFLTRADLRIAPQQLLERLHSRVDPPPSITALAIALDERGELHADPQQVPDFLLIYLAVAGDDRRIGIARRVVSVNPESSVKAFLLENQLPELDTRLDWQDAPAHSKVLH